MHRRLTVAMVGVVTAALVLAGLFTLLLVRRSAADEARRELVRQASDIAAQAGDPETFRVLGGVVRSLQLEGLARVTFGPAGTPLEALPAGITAADLSPHDLRDGRVVSGTKGSLAYAAAPVTPPRAVARRQVGLVAVVLTRQADPGLQRGGSWFVLASLATLGIAAAVSYRLSRRITSPLSEAENATKRIAAGDLTARVRERHDADPEVASLVRSINTMAENLARSRGLERQFLMSVSHELRTPLTSIRGFAEAITDGATDDTRRAATVIAAESRRLERLVGDLLELAQLDARRFSLQLSDVDVATIVTDTAESFRPAAEEAGLVLIVETLPLVARADRDRLAQVVANLVENALKFAARNLTVSVSGSDAARPEVRILVDDDGPGIPAGDLPHVFERLYQSARKPARQVGSGLGLAIVAELVTAMGGEVGAIAPPGGGTRMEVSLRRSDGDSSSSSRKSSSTTTT
jgi:two-component system sensor histidine kinase BaeS